MAITLMAHPSFNRGIALLVAVIFMSVMLTFGLVLGSFAYKQTVLTSSNTQSQYAFYAADAGLECALYYDNKLGYFPFPASDPGDPGPSITCNGSAPVTADQTWTASEWRVFNRIALDAQRCVDVTIIKKNTGETYVFSQGYSAACLTGNLPTGARFVSRGLKASY